MHASQPVCEVRRDMSHLVAIAIFFSEKINIILGECQNVLFGCKNILNYALYFFIQSIVNSKINQNQPFTAVACTA